MKKVAKVVVLVLLILVVLIVCIVVYASGRPAVPADYVTKVDASGEREAQYFQTGKYEVKNLSIPVMENYVSYQIYYPAELEYADEKYPVVIFSNGTGVKAKSYQALFEHLASWGFIVMGTQEEYSWNGFSSEMCLRLIVKLNENETYSDWETNPFYGKADLDHIGVSGHSQGGVGVINAATDTAHADMVKAIYAASCTNKELASALEWDFDATKIKVPILLVAGTGEADSGMILPIESMREIYSDIPESVTKVMMRRKNVDHGDMLYYGDGYMTAWFLWHLKGDGEAAKVFSGQDAEILQNADWQDVQINIP